MFHKSTSTCWHQKFIFNCHTIKTVGVPSIRHRFHTADDAITLDGEILLYDPLSSYFGHTILPQISSLTHHHFTHTAHLIFSIMFCASLFSFFKRFSDITSIPSTVLAGRSTSQFPQYLTLCKRTTSSVRHPK